MLYPLAKTRLSTFHNRVNGLHFWTKVDAEKSVKYVAAAGLGYAVDSRTYYILGFWRSEADKLGQATDTPELFA